MELALSLGMPARMLAASITEEEFGQWYKFSKGRMLPWQRMEWYLAQIAYLVAATMGGAPDLTLADFIAKPVGEKATDEIIDPATQLELAKQALQFRPRVKKKE